MIMITHVFLTFIDGMIMVLNEVIIPSMGFFHRLMTGKGPQLYLIAKIKQHMGVS